MDAADDAGFRVLFDEHFADLWRFARRRLSSAADADDVTAEVFAVAWRRRDDAPRGGDVRLWLFGVARFVLANQRRGDARRLRLQARLASQGDRNGLTSTVVTEPHASLREAFDGLGETDREILIMRYWDDLAVHQIAALLGCTANAASLRLHKARRRLAHVLDETDRSGTGQVSGDPAVRKERGDA